MCHVFSLDFLLLDILMFIFPLIFRDLTFMLTSCEEVGNLSVCPLKQFFLMSVRA